MADNNLIRLRCPRLSCRSVLAVPVKARGKLVKCRNCGNTIKVPASSNNPDAKEKDAA